MLYTTNNFDTLTNIATQKPTGFRFIGLINQNDIIIIYPDFQKIEDKLAFEFLEEFSLEEISSFLKHKNNHKLIIEYGKEHEIFDKDGLDIINSQVNLYCSQFNELKDIDKELNLLLAQMPAESNVTKFLALLNDKVNSAIHNIEYKFDQHYHTLENDYREHTTTPR